MLFPRPPSQVEEGPFPDPSMHLDCAFGNQSGQASQYFPQVSAYTPVNHKMQCSLLVRQAQKYRQFTDYYGYGCHSLYIHTHLYMSTAYRVQTHPHSLSNWPVCCMFWCVM